MNLKKYVYDRNKFCIPVTKPKSLSSIQFIVEEFIKKRLSFCINGEGEYWELWRHVEEEDDDKIKKGSPPTNPKYLYVDGEKVEEYEILK